MRNETKTQSENHSCELSPSFPLTDIVCPPSTGRELTKLKGEDFFERGERALASPPPPPPLPDSGRGLPRSELVAVRVQGALCEDVL